MTIVDNYQQIILQNTPLIDVRAPVEFVKGSIPNATNLPLMNDEERHLVGICYKEKGQDAAITLGHKLVSGDLKQQRVNHWGEFFDSHPNSHILCFRGGLRSKTSQQWIIDSGRDIPLIKGGYKALRQYCIEQTELIVGQMPLCMVGGKTGSGKTELLMALGDTLDLEGIANHRGSAFGKNITEQPSQINFENEVAKRLLQLQQMPYTHLVVEDESRTVGRCALPLVLLEKMRQSPVYWLEDDIDHRAQRILHDYVVDMDLQYRARFGDEVGFERFSEYLKTAFNGIRRRLGDLRHTQLLETLQQALNKQQSQNDASDHLQWIMVLLSEYYDPIYQYQLTNKQDRIVHRGNKDELLEVLRAQRMKAPGVEALLEE
ncbi:MAG: tRNA 2-selenouridine synthase [Phenylobacterium sp.]|jgi:tRNA 2-selenouridine synthase